MDDPRDLDEILSMIRSLSRHIPAERLLIVLGSAVPSPSPIFSSTHPYARLDSVIQSIEGTRYGCPSSKLFLVNWAECVVTPWRPSTSALVTPCTQASEEKELAVMTRKS